MLAFFLVGACIAQSGNLFLNSTYYVNPSYQLELNTSIATATGDVKSTLQRMLQVPSAYWVDVMGKISGNSTRSVEGILADAASKRPPQLVVFIIYDLPNRDCHAKASNGEICCNQNGDGTCDYDKGGDCAAGIQTYKTKYIDPIAALFKKYNGKVPIVAVIEPDSLPNLATNQGDPHCGNSATTAAYTIGIPYAINTIASQAPAVAMYLDAAHGGWLGWENNMQLFGTLVGKLNVVDKLRGFSTNVANYQPLGTACPAFDWCLNNAHPGDACCNDPCRLESQWNPANNEHNYVLEMARTMKNLGMAAPQFIIDTGRNGVAGMRSNCANWCNIRGAGVGLIPTTNTASPLIDAYYWLKTPGESDGCTQQLPNGNQCARFDSFCGSDDSLGSRSGEPRAPVAGQWFDYEVKQLASNQHLDG